MPYWYGLIDTSSPPLLESCNGDPVKVRERIMESAPQGANVRSISWERGQDVAAVIVEGPGARQFLEVDLQARNVTELVNAHERTAERNG
jgi:hypothetical protein